jgi:autotransporter family porin
MRRASVAAALGVLLTVAACASAAPQGQAPAAAHRGHGHPAAAEARPQVDALAAAAPKAAGAAEAGNAPARKPAALMRSALGPAYFHTLPPGATLPSGGQCARWVRARPITENKGVNRAANQATGQHVAPGFLAGDGPQAGQLIVPRISGNFTGTTAEILRWAACKWGIDQDIVFAQAAVESWWRQTTLGDWESSGCPPGHGPGVDGKPGLCPQSWGILQNRYPYEQSSWPGIADSTAMNADTAYAIWRSCYDGYETWLNTVPHAGTYRSGDAWGCVGRWFAGRWHTAPAQQYIRFVKKYLRERIWLQPDFQQP